jgi:hypothetical protein
VTEISRSSSDMKHEPSFVLLHPSLLFLYVALTQLVGFAFGPWALADPTGIVEPILDTVAISCDV